MRIPGFFRLPLLKYCTMAPVKPIKLIWIDMEMTGLELDKNEIMEIACIVTNHDLQPLHKGFETVIHVDDSKLNSMNEWCTINHQKNGLTEACRKSQISLQQAENQLCTYIETHSDRNDMLYMAGNTIYMDRMFLNKYMPAVNDLLHYRMVDVSSVKILRESWYPRLGIPKKNFAHRALDDIRGSIRELQEYRKNIFK